MSYSRIIQSDLVHSTTEISHKPTQADITAALALVTTATNQTENDKYKLFRAAVIAKLAKIFSHFKDHIPYQQATLNVASLGCGDPDDFLALTLFLKTVNPTCELNYVGLEINAESNTQMRTEYQNYPNIKLITVDASDLAATKEQLAAENALPATGFDFILLRQPEILSMTHGSLFERMLTRTIPFLAHEQSTVFVSVYGYIESITAQVFFKAYTKPQNYELQISKVAARKNSHGNWLEAESFSYILKCKGLSLNLQNEVVPNKLFHEIRNFVPTSGASKNILKFINHMQFQQAFLYASAACHVGYMKIILSYRHEFGFDFEQNAEDIRSATNYVKASGASFQDKLAALELFIQCNNEDKAALEEISNAPRPSR